MGVQVLRLLLPTKTSWLCAAGHDRTRGSRRRTGHLSYIGGRAIELSPNHQTAERRSHADAHRQEPRLASGDGQKHPDQSRLCWASALQLSAASDPAVSQAGGTPTALSQDRAKLSVGERMGVER